VRFAVYRGEIVKVEEVRENTVWINDDGISVVVNKDELVLTDSLSDERLQEMASIKVKINDLKDRMHRLDKEYINKMEALRIMYLDARSSEIRIANQIIKEISK
jgi:hypothetical protein